MQPLPTWKLTPTTSRPSSLARSRRPRHARSCAPNLILRRHTALESSVAIRSTSLEEGGRSEGGGVRGGTVSKDTLAITDLVKVLSRNVSHLALS